MCGVASPPPILTNLPPPPSNLPAPYGLTDEAVIGLNLNYRDISSLLNLHPRRMCVYSIVWKIEIFEKNFVQKS